MAVTFKAIATTTVGSGGASSIDFSSIPATYTDLVIKLSLRQSSINIAYGLVYFNNSSANFTFRSIEGSGSTAVSASGSTGPYGIPTPSSYTANSFSNIEIYIPNYAGGNNKSYSVDAVIETNAATAYSDLIAGLWSQTTAINRLTFYPVAGTFDQYSSITLYGIKNS
jgi:hypothetical protein